MKLGKLFLNEVRILYEKAVVDRVVDGKHAVLLVGGDEEERVVPMGLLPGDVKEGQWLRVRFKEGALLEALSDSEETEQVTQRVQSKMELLRRRGRTKGPGSKP